MAIPTAEHARKAHPDIFANTTAEAIVRYAVSVDPLSRVDVGISIGYDPIKKIDVVTVNGNATTAADMSEAAIHRIVQGVAKSLGYAERFGFSPDSFLTYNHINKQSPEIAPHATNGVSADSRPCVGYACDETGLYLSRSVVTARQISRALDREFSSNPLILGPDGKIQVTFGEDHLKRVVLHAQRNDSISDKNFEGYLKGLLAALTDDTEFQLLSFVNGGPRADKGQSGTKSLMYGEALPNGGGGFYGLDATKPERYGTALARQIAKSVVAAGRARRCLVRVAYSMGTKQPDIFIESAPELNDDLTAHIQHMFPLSPSDAIASYGLRDTGILTSIIYDGFIGNENMPWEKLVKL